MYLYTPLSNSTFQFYKLTQLTNVQCKVEVIHAKTLINTDTHINHNVVYWFILVIHVNSLNH